MQGGCWAEGFEGVSEQREWMQGVGKGGRREGGSHWNLTLFLK